MPCRERGNCIFGFRVLPLLVGSPLPRCCSLRYSYFRPTLLPSLAPMFSVSTHCCRACDSPVPPTHRRGRPRSLCPSCTLTAVVTSAYEHAAPQPSSHRWCLFCRIKMSRARGALTCSTRCRVALSRARVYLARCFDRSREVAASVRDRLSSFAARRFVPESPLPPGLWRCYDARIIFDAHKAFVDYVRAHPPFLRPPTPEHLCLV